VRRIAQQKEKKLLLFGLSLLVVLADQATKFWIQAHMSYGESIPIIHNVFHITYILNAGAAFGLLEHQTWFFVGVAILLIAGAAYLYPRLPADKPLLKWGAGLLTGGAVGNLIDRVHTGYVVDFFDFRIWPIFNVADICIVCGVSCLVYVLMTTVESPKPPAEGS
jgi:signal peptidase II